MIKPSSLYVQHKIHPAIHIWICCGNHYYDVIMGAIASQITSLTIVYSIVCSDADQKKTSKLRVTGLCAGNSSGTGEFPAQMASNAENASIWWRHHGISFCGSMYVTYLLKLFDLLHGYLDNGTPFDCQKSACFPHPVCMILVDVSNVCKWYFP